MQKTLTPQHPSNDDRFAGDAVKDAEETGIPLSSVSIVGRSLCNLRFADDIDLLGGSDKLQQIASERLEKAAADHQQHQAKPIHQHIDEWKNAGRSGPVQTERE